MLLFSTNLHNTNYLLITHCLLHFDSLCIHCVHCLKFRFATDSFLASLGSLESTFCLFLNLDGCKLVGGSLLCQKTGFGLLTEAGSNAISHLLLLVQLKMIRLSCDFIELFDKVHFKVRLVVVRLFQIEVSSPFWRLKTFKVDFQDFHRIRCNGQEFVLNLIF